MKTKNTVELISTTNFQFKGYEGRKGFLKKLNPVGDHIVFYFDMISDWIETSSVAHTELENDIFKIYTINSIYIFRILEKNSLESRDFLV